MVSWFKGIDRPVRAPRYSPTVLNIKKPAGEVAEGIGFSTKGLRAELESNGAKQPHTGLDTLGWYGLERDDYQGHEAQNPADKPGQPPQPEGGPPPSGDPGITPPSTGQPLLPDPPANGASSGQGPTLASLSHKIWNIS